MRPLLLTALALAPRAGGEGEGGTPPNATACASCCGSAPSAEEHHDRLGLVMVLLMLAVALAVGYAAEQQSWCRRWLPHASCSLAVGVAAGWMIMRLSDHAAAGGMESVLQFSDEFFFLFLLPPIIFESGFNMDHEQTKAFVRNVGPIIWFALAGTLLSCIVTAAVVYAMGAAGAAPFADDGGGLTKLESMAFGALIAATDPVTVLSVFGQGNVNLDLFSLVFGESVLNDAIAIILYGALDELRQDSDDGGRGEYEFAVAISSTVVLFCAALTIGLCSGMASSWLFKHLFRGKDEDFTVEQGLLVVCPRHRHRASTRLQPRPGRTGGSANNIGRSKGGGVHNPRTNS